MELPTQQEPRWILFWAVYPDRTSGLATTEATRTTKTGVTSRTLNSSCKLNRQQHCRARFERAFCETENPGAINEHFSQPTKNRTRKLRYHRPSTQDTVSI